MTSIASFIESHFGALVASALAIYLVIAYTRGEVKPLFAFIREMLSGPDGKASTKRFGMIAGMATLCWSFAKITLAICRRIDSPTSPLDPTTIFVVELSVIAALAGVAYVFGKAIAARYGSVEGMDKVADLTKDDSHE